MRLVIIPPALLTLNSLVHSERCSPVNCVLMNPSTSNYPATCSVPIPPCGIWLCYILCCADDTLYTGITNNLKKRLAAHNTGTAARYTRSRGPVELVFVESCADKSAALKREMEIKSLVRAEKLALIAATPCTQVRVRSFIFSPYL
jgi:putative endonuclease